LAARNQTINASWNNRIKQIAIFSLEISILNADEGASGSISGLKRSTFVKLTDRPQAFASRAKSAKLFSLIN
jgi:hypothetical protein